MSGGPLGMGYIGPRGYTEAQRAKSSTPTKGDLLRAAEIANASFIPGVADAAAGLLAVEAARQGNYGEAALNAVGLLPFVPALGTKFVRRSQSAATPFNDVGYAMFAKAGDDVDEALDGLRNYGPAKWVADDNGAEDARNLLRDITRALRQSGAHEEYGTTAAALAREAAPGNIVDSAGIWDNPDLVGRIYESVLEPKGIMKVRTPDGLILFDPSQATAVK